MATLERAAGDVAHGRVAHAEIVAAISRAKDGEALVPRAVPRAACGIAGFTTREGVGTEPRILAMEV